MTSPRLSGLYRLPVAERINRLESAGVLTAADAQLLRSGQSVLSLRAADSMVENVIGRFLLPLAIAPDFVVNQRAYLVPLVVEEPSVVAALSSAARRAAQSGGFSASCSESLLTAQIHVHAVANAQRACAAVLQARDALKEKANSIHPRLIARGGGVRDIDVRTHDLDDKDAVVAVHIHVDTCDAMGANLVNTIAEALAPDIAALCEGQVVLRILSNLAERSLVTANVHFALDVLATGGESAEVVRDRIVLASRIAAADPYRAVTHNKGIMNGIDPLAIATGNDWRAIEAGAHAFAARGGQYAGLATWSVADDGGLNGTIVVPLKPGIVGGTVASNPGAALCLRIVAVESAMELAQLMAAVGLAQNFSALRALVTSGIQAGHMRLHARSVAASAGVPEALLPSVVRDLVASGEIKDWKARELLAQRQPESDAASAAGKVILLGEHAVVYGSRALALPIPDAVRATVRRSNHTRISIAEWNVSEDLAQRGNSALRAAVSTITSALAVPDEGFDIQVTTRLPRAMGLGSSAALAVALTRAFAMLHQLQLETERVNEIAFECEKLAHGTPSGVDNTIASYAAPALFRRGPPLEVQIVTVSEAPPIVIACSDIAGRTIEQVERVRTRHALNPKRYDRLFAEIDELSAAGAPALEAGDYETLGMLMNICHGLLNALEVSQPQLEHMVALARAAGATGAKLTGAGGGGSIVALCPDAVDDVETALQQAGFRTITLQPASKGSAS
jgi:hydroxymethylglutaryl-CoA reductase